MPVDGRKNAVEKGTWVKRGKQGMLPQSLCCIASGSQRLLESEELVGVTPLFCVVSSLGLEPRTHALKGRCSTN